MILHTHTRTQKVKNIILKQNTLDLNVTKLKKIINLHQTKSDLTNNNEKCGAEAGWDLRCKLAAFVRFWV